ncbi:MAG: DUF6006 family protein [Hyphomicrobiales bacterium]|nr:DUF6006 family protein [Hyphomicrobiales bacterium]
MRSRLKIILFALAVSPAAPALAGQAVGWWGGQWTCVIDGRPAKMKWDVLEAPETTCSGGTCTTSSGVRWKGSFSDNGSAWVPLTNAREGSQGGLFFNHADGNQWYLAKPVGNVSTGWTTWNNQRYSLSCRR